MFVKLPCKFIDRLCMKVKLIQVWFVTNSSLSKTAKTKFSHEINNSYVSLCIKYQCTWVCLAFLKQSYYQTRSCARTLNHCLDIVKISAEITANALLPHYINPHKPRLFYLLGKRHAVKCRHKNNACCTILGLAQNTCLLSKSDRPTFIQTL